jgi:pyroglutamyl-peptidase
MSAISVPVAAAPVQRAPVLVTGFDPFDGASVNPSWQAVQALHGETIAGHRVIAACLPTVFGASLQALRHLLHTHRPAWVLCVGQAGGRAALSLERVAINLDDAPIADNRGARPVDTPVCEGAPAAYFSSLPIKAMRSALQAAGIPAEVSQTAGTFVCNHVFYGLMHALATDPLLRGARGGFVHVPWLPGQGSPSLAPEQVVLGLRIALQQALTLEVDTAESAGATH